MKRILVYYYARIGGVYRELFLTFPWAIKFLYVPGFNKLRNFNSRARAYYQFRNAKKNVPAYQAFLKERSFNEPRFKGFVPLIEDIPWMDKDNYIKKFDMDSRCIDGKIPERNIIFDESSGSSGTATNWVRGKTERKRNAKIIRFGFETLFGKEPHFIVNAFALGPWATGVNVTMSCVPFSRLKSLGPEKTKIENTLLQFGTKYKYVVMGYPPFLKQLVEGDTVPWQDYDISFIFGGESMSEGMRDFLYARGIKKVYSSLGASDLELNIGSENDFTISVRRLMRSNEKLRREVEELRQASETDLQPGTIEYERHRLTRAQADAQELKNARDSAEVVETAFCTFVLSRIAGEIASILDGIPLSVQRRFPELENRHVDFLKRDIIKAMNKAAALDELIPEHGTGRRAGGRAAPRLRPDEPAVACGAQPARRTDARRCHRHPHRHRRGARHRDGLRRPAALLDHRAVGPLPGTGAPGGPGGRGMGDPPRTSRRVL